MTTSVRSVIGRGAALVGAAVAFCLLVAGAYFAGSGVAHRYAVQCADNDTASCRHLTAAPGFDLLVVTCVRTHHYDPHSCAEYRKA